MERYEVVRVGDVYKQCVVRTFCDFELKNDGMQERANKECKQARKNN